MDWTLRKFGDLRDRTLAAAVGDVLEIGFGTGLNVAHYPGGVKSLTALDPARGPRRLVERRIAAARMPIRREHDSAERLPFEDARFDCVVTTFTLCTIPEPVHALCEMRRVLRPGGAYLFLEHGRSDDLRVARRQDFWNPIQRRIGCGCNLNRQIDALIREARFEFAELERFQHPRMPRIAGHLYRGVAVDRSPA